MAKPAFAVQVTSQFLQGTFDSVNFYRIAEHEVPASRYSHGNGLFWIDSSFRNVYTGTQCGTAVIHLCLGKIQCILPFYTARTHIVSNGIRLNNSRRIDKKCHLRLRHIPRRVLADDDQLPLPGYTEIGRA